MINKMSIQKLIRITLSSTNHLNARNLCSVNSVKEVSLKSKESKDTTSSVKQSNSDNSLCSVDGQWHISCGLVIQRFPLILPEFNIIERSLYEQNLKLEREKSLLSEYDYAIQKVRTENSKEEKYLKLVSNYDRYLKEAESFKDFGKKTKDDLSNNLKSHNRCLDRSLFLATKLNIGTEPFWTFPFASLEKEDDSLRTACERLLEKIDKKSKFRILGNSPFAYAKLNYPAKVSERLNIKGNKIFYFKCQLIDLKNELQIEDTNLISDYEWLSFDECGVKLKKIWKWVGKGIFVENMDDVLLDTVNRKLSEKKIQLSNF